MSKARDPNTTQHDYDFAHYGELPLEAFPPHMLVSSTTMVAAFLMDGGGYPITSGVKGVVPFFFNATIESVTLLADVSGSCELDIQKDAYSAYPPTFGDSIVASAPPELNNQIKYQDTTLTGWTVDINVGDVLKWEVVSSSTIGKLTCALRLRRVP